MKDYLDYKGMTFWLDPNEIDVIKAAHEVDVQGADLYEVHVGGGCVLVLEATVAKLLNDYVK